MRGFSPTHAPRRLAAALALLACAAAHADIDVPAGSTISLGGGSSDLACTDLIVAGNYSLAGGTLTNVRHVVIASGGTLTLAAGGAITLAGDWTNNGTVAAAGGTVSFVDDVGCATAPTQSAISGNTAFDSLSIVSSSGKLYQFAAGSTQTVTSALTLQGSGAPLRIESTTPGSVTAALQLDAAGSQNLSNLAVRGMSAPSPGQWLAPGQTNQGAGPVSRWFGTPGDGAAPIPTLSPLSLAGLGLALAAFAARRRRTSVQKASSNSRSHLS